MPPSEAASDHLVRAWHETFGLPTVISNGFNNYGPYHFPEKLILLTILKALHGEPIPVYGKDDNIRDWLFVEDDARVLTVSSVGRSGETYNIGGDGERTKLAVVTTICGLLDDMLPDSPHQHPAKLITFVADRPGHDRRYAIAWTKLRDELGWRPRESFRYRATEDRRLVSEQPLVVGPDLVGEVSRRPARHRRYAVTDSTDN